MCVTQPGDRVLADGGQARGVGAERHGHGRGSGSLDHEELLAGACVPQPCCPISAGGGQARSPGVEGHPLNPITFSLERAEQLPRACVPQSRFIALAGGQARAVRTERDDDADSREKCQEKLACFGPSAHHGTRMSRTMVAPAKLSSSPALIQRSSADTLTRFQARSSAILQYFTD